MNQYRIIYGLGGGFNIKSEGVYECKSTEEAEELGYELAMQEYDGYAGMYGLRDIDMIMEQDECSEDEANGIYLEEASSWIYYEVDEVK